MQDVPERHTTHSQRSFDEFSRRYHALLHTADIVSQRGFPDLLQEVSDRLHEIFPFDFLNCAVHCPPKNVMRLHMLDRGSRVLEQLVELPIDISPSGWVWSHQQPLELSNLDLENRFPAVLDLYKARGVRSLLVLPMNTAHSRLGTLGFGSGHLTKYDEDTLRFLTRITGLVALAVENSSIKQALATEEEQLRSLTAITGELVERSTRVQEELQKERNRTQTLLEINSALVASRLDLQQMFPAISDSLRSAVPHDAAIISLWDEEEGVYRTYALGTDHPEKFPAEGWTARGEESVTNQILAKAEGGILHRSDLEEYSSRFAIAKHALDAGLVSWCVAPMRSAGLLIGVLYLGSRQEDNFAQNDL